ncbi:transcriptional regulator [Agrobacterium pusense]|uniref:transcriptional regulator n=1 Tax=Agrobacterium pusense TaxID=648995 RepID=UPI000DD3B362
MSDFRPHIRRAIEVVGSQEKLAEKAGCSQQQISWLLTRAKKISAEHAVCFEQATDGAVTRSDLRPDLFPMQGADAA